MNDRWIVTEYYLDGREQEWSSEYDFYTLMTELTELWENSSMVGFRVMANDEMQEKIKQAIEGRSETSQD